MDLDQWRDNLWAIGQRRRRLSLSAAYGHEYPDPPIPFSDEELGAWHADPAAVVARRKELETLNHVKQYLISELARHRKETVDKSSRTTRGTAPARGGIDLGLAIIDRILKVEDRITRIMGLDAPRRREAMVITEETIEREMKRLEALGVDLENPD